jgi:hypothetical protein
MYIIYLFAFGAHRRSTPSSLAIIVLFLAIVVDVVLTLVDDGTASKPLQTPATNSCKPCALAQAAMAAL